MSWQDVVLSIANVFFFVALIPSLRGKVGCPPERMCWITALTLLACAFAQFTLDLYGASVCTTVLSAAWVIMGYRRYITPDLRSAMIELIDADMGLARVYNRMGSRAGITTAEVNLARRKADAARTKARIALIGANMWRKHG